MLAAAAGRKDQALTVNAGRQSSLRQSSTSLLLTLKGVDTDFAVKFAPPMFLHCACPASVARSRTHPSESSSHACRAWAAAALLDGPRPGPSSRPPCDTSGQHRFHIFCRVPPRRRRALPGSARLGPGPDVEYYKAHEYVSMEAALGRVRPSKHARACTRTDTCLAIAIHTTRLLPLNGIIVCVCVCARACQYVCACVCSDGHRLLRWTSDGLWGGGRGQGRGRGRGRGQGRGLERARGWGKGHIRRGLGEGVRGTTLAPGERDSEP